MVSLPILEDETIPAIDRPGLCIGALPALEIVGALKQFRKEEGQKKAFWKRGERKPARDDRCRRQHEYHRSARRDLRPAGREWVGKINAYPAWSRRC